MEINELIENVRSNIEDNKIRMNNVGNRPHYPVFVSFYDSKIKNCLAFINNLQNTWSSQICKNLLFYRYVINDSRLKFFDVRTDTCVSTEQVYEHISESARTRDVVFARRDKWCTYNILDTSEMTFEQFEQGYSSLSAFEEVVDERIQSMIVVIIRDGRSQERKKINYQIRNFLMRESIYDSVIIVSNRARGGLEVESEELYKIVSNLILLSNNDAVTPIDDEYYIERTTKLYCRKPLLVSYNSLCKPIKDILYCMIDKLFEEVNDKISYHYSNSLTPQEIYRIFGIENDKIKAFDEFIYQAEQNVVRELDYSSIVQHIPLYSPSIIAQSEIEIKPIEHLGDISFDSLRLIANNYCDSLIRSDYGKQVFEKYEKSIHDNLNIVNVSSITKEKVMDAFDEVLKGVCAPSKSETARNYLRLLVVYILKSKYIIPHCILLAETICDEKKIADTRNSIALFRQKLDEELPIAGFNEIPIFYGKNMIQYLSTDSGRNRLNQILKVGNTYNDLCSIVEQTLYEANEYCNESINMPFIHVWAKALKLHAGHIFGKIHKILHGDGADAILLRGAYPVIEELSVYMLHCYDRNGDNKTELYSQFREAYRDSDNVQFFNTSDDDSIESIKLYKCEGTSLIIGLKEFVS